MNPSPNHATHDAARKTDATLSIRLEARFAEDLPELAIDWQADAPPEPQLLTLNEGLARDLGLDPEVLKTEEGIQFLTGTRLPAGARPVAQCYAGHQFGGYSPRLGDGRALLLGEVMDASGTLRDIHLKGSGPTPFSRGGDGYAVVGPMLREFVVSEAMHALGIPSTRALAVVQTGRTVYRDDPEKGALLVRVASSHLRVGSFQFARGSNDLDLLRRLADHAIARHYPEAASAENPYLELFNQVTTAQASLIAKWMLVGFVHGVMNTDNMTISGETIDYGPCAFIDDFNPDAVFSSIDHGGRYKFGNQPVVAEWNLARFAESLLPLLADSQDAAVELAQDALGKFAPQYSDAWSAGMREKLGLSGSGGEVAGATEVTAGTAAGTASGAVDGAIDGGAAGTNIVSELFDILKVERVDYTSLFRKLADAARGNTVPAKIQLAGSATFADWLARWRSLNPDATQMDRVNPVYIPRNHILEEALEAASNGDMQPVSDLLELVTNPFTARPGKDRFALPAPDDFGPFRTFCGT